MLIRFIQQSDKLLFETHQPKPPLVQGEVARRSRDGGDIPEQLSVSHWLTMRISLYCAIPQSKIIDF